MCRCLQQSDNETLEMLWKCGLSVTLTCIAGADSTHLLKRSLLASEDYSFAAELTDTWSHWAAKVNEFLKSAPSKKPADQEKWLRDNEICFRGSVASRALVNAVVAMRRFSSESLAVLKKIDSEFGTGVFNSGYVKLVRLSQIAASLPADAAWLVQRSEFLVSMLQLKSQSNFNFQSPICCCGWFCCRMARLWKMQSFGCFRLLMLP